MNHPIHFVSLGPGDPELITLKGLNTLQKADIIYCPATQGKHGIISRATSILKAIEVDESLIHPFILPMSKERTDALNAYNELFLDAQAEYLKGKQIVIVAEGDAGFYSSIQYVYDKFEEAGIPVDRIAGIPAFIAAGALAGIHIVKQEEQINVAGKQQIDLERTEMSKVHNLSDENVTRMDESITDVTGKSEFVEPEEKEPIDKVGWIVRRISEFGGYENVSDSDKADIFGFDIADVSGSIRLFSDAMKRLGIKLDGDELYEEFQKIYDESVDGDAGKDKAEDKMWNRGRGR